MVKKVQLPVIGGVRKVVTVGDSTGLPGTTIAEFGDHTVTLAQLAYAISGLLPVDTGLIGGGSTATITVGPGLSGGGPVLGNVPIRLTAPVGVHLQFAEDGEQGDRGPPGRQGDAGPRGLPIAMYPEDPEEPLFIPGPPGLQGVPGVAGSGQTVVIYPEDPEEPLFIPGQQGLQGLQGPAGAAGTGGGQTVVIYPEDPEESLFIPGPPGVQGPAGPAGTGGSGGSGGNAWMAFLDDAQAEDPLPMLRNAINRFPYGVFDGIVSALPTPTTSGTLALTAAGLSIGFARSYSAGYTEVFASNAVAFGTLNVSELDLVTNASQRVIITGDGRIIVNTPSSGASAAFSVTGAAAANIATLNITGGAFTAGGALSNGIFIQAGGDGTDRPLDVLNRAGTARLFGVFGDGSTTFGGNSRWPNGNTLQWADAGGTLRVVLYGLFSDNNLYMDNNAGGVMNFRTAAGTQVMTFDGSGNLSVPSNLILGNVAPAAVAAGKIAFSGLTSSSATAGGTGALPATVVGYITINVSGTARKIPFYAN